VGSTIFLKSDHVIDFCSELAEPQKMLPYLLNPDIAKLAPETVAVYVHSAAKIFAFWAIELADRWNDDELPYVKSVVDETMEGLQPFILSAESEVQERVSMFGWYARIYINPFSRQPTSISSSLSSRPTWITISPVHPNLRLTAPPQASRT
jgi:hypothetical protein